MLTDYKDEKPKIVECYLGFGYSLQKTFIFQLCIEIFRRHEHYQPLIYKLLREKDLKYSLFLYGINFLNDTPPDFTNNAHKLGKRYVNQLYDRLKLLDKDHLLFHYSKEFENILEFD